MIDKDGRSSGSAMLYSAGKEAPYLVADDGQPDRAAAAADAWSVGAMFSPTAETYGPGYAVLTALSSGGFVVTYLDSNAYLGPEAPLRGRVYSASGNPLGEEFALGAIYDGNIHQLRVAALSHGGFVVVFDDRSGPNGGERLWAQRYDGLGTPEGAQILAADLGTAGRKGATVIGLQSGGFMVFWTASPESWGPMEYRAQIFGPSGEKVGGVFVAATHNLSISASADVAAAADGSFLFAWADLQGMVWGRLFGASGVPSGSAFRIDGVAAGNTIYEISVAALTGGGFAVTWTDGPDYNGGDVRGQVLNSQGGRVGEEFSAHAETTGKQMEGSVTALPDGGFAVAWIDYNQAGANYMGGAARLQMFDAAGNKVGGAVDLEPGAGREHRRTDLITLDGGKLVVAHDDFGDVQGYTPGGSTDIYLQILSPPGSGEARADAVTAAEDTALTGNVLADNGAGVDVPATSAPLVVSEVNGSGAAVGNQIKLPSGALLTLNADGTFRYDPNGAFDSLAQHGIGASNTTGTDSFTYALLGGDTASVTVTVRGVYSGPHYVNGTDGADILTGTAGADVFAGGAGNDRYDIGAGDTVNESAGGGVDEVRTALGSRVDFSQMYVLSANVEKLTGTATAGQGVYANGLDNVVVMGAGSDLVVLQDGGKDLVSGGGGDDYLYWAGTFDNHDRADGGAGYDSVGLLGNLTLAFDADDLVSIEKLAVYGFGDPATPASYTLTMHDANVAAGQQMMIVGQSLRAGETLTFNGAAELDGSFNVRGGWGADTITGGAKADTIWGNLGADTLRGGLGKDLFEYSSVNDSKAGSADVIMDFTKGDKIYLVGIDADGNAANGDSKFIWLGDGAFTGQAGQLRVTQGLNKTWVVEGDVNGDGAADFLLYFVAPLDFVPERSDFYL